MTDYNEKWQYFNNLTPAEFERERKKISDKYSKFELRTEATRTKLDTEMLAFNNVAQHKKEHSNERTTITFRCSEQEKLFISTLAENRGMTMSEIIIEIICDKIAEFKKKKKPKARPSKKTTK